MPFLLHNNAMMNAKEKMMMNELQVIADMKELLLHSEEEWLKWNATRTDLVEMVHILYESGEMRDEFDVPMTFKSLLERCCCILHERVPRNPCNYLRQANNCRGLRRAPLLMRYKGNCWRK